MILEHYIIGALVYHLACCWIVVSIRTHQDEKIRPERVWRVFVLGWAFPFMLLGFGVHTFGRWIIDNWPEVRHTIRPIEKEDL